MTVVGIHSYICRDNTSVVEVIAELAAALSILGSTFILLTYILLHKLRISTHLLLMNLSLLPFSSLEYSSS